MKITFILILLLVYRITHAEETNKLFITDNGFLVADHERLLEEAKKSKESLPAEAFPEGNWGSPKKGFQLSLRFDKPTYTNGENITAIILLRNVTNTTVAY